ncbi:MAG: restriction endonuclease subunit S [bacterium]
MKPYPKYKPSNIPWLGDVPEHWDVRRLGSFFAERTEKVSDKDYPPLSVTKNGIMPQLANAAKSNDGDNRKKVCKGDYVINSRADRKGSSGLSKYDGSISLINTVLIIKNIDEIFSHRILKSFPFVEEFYRVGKGIHNDLWSTQYSEMRKIMFPQPPIYEQHQIARFLDWKITMINKFIKAKKRIIELLKEQKQAIINDAVTGKIDVRTGKPYSKYKPSSVEWLGDIPEKWEVRRLGSLGIFSKGNGVSRSDLVENGVPVILYGDIYTKYNYKIDEIVNKISSETSQNSLSIYNGYLLMTASGETKEDIGKCVVYVGTVTAFAGGDLIIFKQDYCNSTYLSYALNSTSSITQKATKSKGDIIVHLYPSQLKNIKITFPSLRDQLTIVKFIESNINRIDNAIKNIVNELFLVKEYKDRLIADAVTGKVDIRKIKVPEQIEVVEEEVIEEEVEELTDIDEEE